MSLDIPLKQEMTETLPGFLQELDLLVIEDLYLPKSFGNSYVTLQSPKFFVRFVRDRGQVWAEVAPVTAPASWWPLGFVVEAMQGHQPEYKFELSDAAHMLKENFRELANALGPRLPETRREMERHGAERLKAMIGPGKTDGS
ncbi:MAG: hypothetical protein WBE37_30450 [Bryobacteraceae bacterium]